MPILLIKKGPAGRTTRRTCSEDKEAVLRARTPRAPAQSLHSRVDSGMGSREVMMRAAAREEQMQRAWRGAGEGGKRPYRQAHVLGRLVEGRTRSDRRGPSERSRGGAPARPVPENPGGGPLAALFDPAQAGAARASAPHGSRKRFARPTRRAGPRVQGGRLAGSAAEGGLATGCPNAEHRRAPLAHGMILEMVSGLPGARWPRDVTACELCPRLAGLVVPGGGGGGGGGVGGGGGGGGREVAVVRVKRYRDR
jgi:hypothetical protein